MKKIILLLSGIALCLSLQAQIADDQEYIKNFISNITVFTSGEIEVSESIYINALGYEFKRGLVRWIPLKRKTKNGRSTKTPIEIVSIAHNGKKSEYHTKEENGYLAIYIGSADVFIDHGIHKYEIVYKTTNQIGFYNTYDEIYWNATGNEWAMPILQSNCKVYLPRGAKIMQQACYTGAYGQQGYKCQMSDSGDEFVSFSSGELAPYEGLTVAVGFKKAVVMPPPPPTWWETWRLRIIATLSFIVMAVYYVSTWQQYGRDPEAPVPFPQFTPPPGLSLSEIGMINHENYSNRYLSATVLQWAVNGFVKITEDKDSYLFNLIQNTTYTVKKLKAPDNSFKPHEARLFNSLFSGSDEFTIDGKYNASLYSAGEKFRSDTQSLYDHSEYGKGNNYKYVAYGSLLLICFGLLMVFFDRDKIFIIATGVILCILTLVPFIVSSIFKSTQVIGVRLYHQIAVWLLLIPTAVFIPLYIWPNILELDERVVIIFTILGIVSVLVYARLIKQPTSAKLKLQSELEGFKMYLKMAENERVKLLNPPAETPELFEKYLPYAVLFKVEKVWGDRFREMLSASPEHHGYTASWYSGNNFSGFTDSFSQNGFGSSFSSSSTQPSNYSSGSGGGGFSGGGGGGGGGGGW